MTSRTICAALIAAGLSLTAGAARGEDWGRFRGPNGSGIADGGDYPTEFGPNLNVRWQAPVRTGKSSPVLTKKHVFLTAFEDKRLFTQCFDRSNGKLLWERAVERQRETDLHQLNEPSSMSPVTDGENVYVFFRDFGLISYTSAGEVRWKAPLGPSTNFMGLSSSPILDSGLLIVQADQVGGSYVAGFNLSNGETQWKTPRGEGQGWATPLIYKPPSGRSQIVTASRGWIGGHRLEDGKRLWGKAAISPAIVASPIVDGNTVYVFGYGIDGTSDFEGSFNQRDKDGDAVLGEEEYASSAFMVGLAKHTGDHDGVLTMPEWLSGVRSAVAPSSLVAFRFEDTDEPRELWRYKRAFNGVIPSALAYGGVLYLIKNGGILETLDAETGRSLKRGRIREAIEGYSASPVAADGKVYFTSEDGKVAVLRAAGEWEVLAVNDLGKEVYATPALSEGKLFIRTSEHLYCFAR